MGIKKIFWIMGLLVDPIYQILHTVIMTVAEQQYRELLRSWE